MISQSELAQRANITRSSVAVHISNLMKKGYIQGKGYVLRQAPYVAVVGGVNVDINGIIAGEPVFQDSNPGEVEVTLGGVGRNQAHNLRLLDIDVKMVSVFGEDVYAEKIRNNCRELGIDIRGAYTVPDGVTSTYVSVMGPDGKLCLGVADMTIYDSLTPSILATKMQLVNRSSVCVTDTNLTREALEYLADNCRVPLFAETISTAKAGKLWNSLNRVHTLKTTLAEVQHLLGRAIHSQADAKDAAQALLDKGVQAVYMDMHDDRVYCMDRQEAFVLHYPASGVCAKSGARDSFTAALVWAHMNGLGIRDAARAGVAAASICAEGKHVVNDKLCEEELRRVMSGERIPSPPAG